jgi:NADPH:quinone reductase-like Zn-dependent oxidoreductase
MLSSHSSLLTLESVSPLAMPAPVHSFTATEALSERRLLADGSEIPKRQKRVVVTGGSGNLGRCVVREMVDHGWDVINCEG